MPRLFPVPAHVRVLALRAQVARLAKKCVAAAVGGAFGRGIAEVVGFEAQCLVGDGHEIREARIHGGDQG